MKDRASSIRAVDRYFEPWIKGLLRWEEAINSRGNPTDLVALLCIYIDSLGTSFLWHSEKAPAQHLRTLRPFYNELTKGDRYGKFIRQLLRSVEEFASAEEQDFWPADIVLNQLSCSQDFFHSTHIKPALQKLVEAFSLGAIFYRDYRCEVVHR